MKGPAIQPSRVPSPTPVPGSPAYFLALHTLSWLHLLEAWCHQGRGPRSPRGCAVCRHGLVIHEKALIWTKSSWNDDDMTTFFSAHTYTLIQTFTHTHMHTRDSMAYWYRQGEPAFHTGPFPWGGQWGWPRVVQAVALSSLWLLPLVSLGGPRPLGSLPPGTTSTLERSGGWLHWGPLLTLVFQHWVSLFSGEAVFKALGSSSPRAVLLKRLLWVERRRLTRTRPRAVIQADAERRACECPWRRRCPGAHTVASPLPGPGFPALAARSQGTSGVNGLHL